MGSRIKNRVVTVSFPSSGPEAVIRIIELVLCGLFK